MNAYSMKSTYFKNLNMDEIKPILDVLNQVPKIDTEPEEPDHINLFGALDLSEVRLSRLYAYLLNPKATQDTNGVILRSFCEVLKEIPYLDQNGRDDFLYDQIDNQEICVETERTFSDNRRIDILIQSDNQFIGIENKPYAGDQENQLEDYAKRLEELSVECNQNSETKDGPSSQWILVYMADHEPTEFSIKTDSPYRNKIKVFKSKHWIDCLQKALKSENLQNTLVTELCKELIVYFEGKMTKPEWFDGIIKEESNLLPLFQIINSGEGIKQHFRDVFFNEFEDKCNKNSEKFNPQKDGINKALKHERHATEHYVKHPKADDFPRYNNIWFYIDMRWSMAYGIYIPKDSPFRDKLIAELEKCTTRLYKAGWTLSLCPGTETDEGKKILGINPQDPLIDRDLWNTDGKSNILAKENRAEIIQFLLDRAEYLFALIDKISTQSK